MSCFEFLNHGDTVTRSYTVLSVTRCCAALCLRVAVVQNAVFLWFKTVHDSP